MRMIILLFILSTVGYSQDNNSLFERQWGVINKEQPIYIRSSELQLDAQLGILGFDIDYTKTTYSNETIVAVIDSGIDISHKEFEGRLWRDSNCKSENENTCIGKNILNPKIAAVDDTGHGTHVAGIIAAQDNNIGVFGITNENVKIMPLKVISKKTTSYVYNKKRISDYFADAIVFAVDNGANVINISAGFPSLVVTKKVKDSISHAIHNNVLIVAAAGNNNKDIPVFPCNQQDVLCVGSINNRGQISEFSNFGQKVDLLAPGESIVSTYPTQEQFESRLLRIHGFETKKGTSQASPYVAGVAAAIYQKFPDIKISEVKARLLSTSLSVNQDERKFTSYGLVQMKKALDWSGEQTVVYPLFKNIDKVLVNNDKSFKFKLDFKRLNGAKSARILFANNNYSIATESKVLDFKNNTGEYLVEGRVRDLNEHNILKLRFSIEIDGIKTNFRFNAFATLKIDKEKTLNVKIDEDPRNIVVFKNKKKSSLLRDVMSMTGRLDTSEFFYKDYSYKGEKGQHFVLLNLKDSSFQKKSFYIPKDEDLQFLVKGDFNKDGTMDYVLQKAKIINKKVSFLINFLTDELKPLYETRSEWTYEPDGTLNVGETLFKFSKRRPEFSWINYNDSTLGQILVPLIFGTGYMPTTDNGDGILEYDYNLRQKDRYYVFLPNEENKLSISVMNTYYIEERMREELDLYSWESIQFESIISSKNGEVSLLISTGEEQDRLYYHAHFTHKENYQLTPIGFNNYSIILNANGAFSFMEKQFSNEKLLFALFSRNKGRLAFLDENNIKGTLNISSDSYRDPFFGYLGSSKDKGVYTSVFESRYWMHLYTSDKEHLKLPINRESSFPGVSFSELMEPVKLSSGSLGIFVNSTLLYGDQLYVVTKNKYGFVRPINKSLTLPSNCAYVLPGRIDKKDYFILNCVEKRQSVLKFIEMK